MAYISREISVGNVKIGGSHPVRFQSMTNTHTMNTRATVEQSIRMIEAGAEMVRITARNLKEAENLKVIKNELHQAGYEVPLIADIHFNPKVAEIAAGHVEKIRINPGNYAGRNAKGKMHFTEEEYQQDLDKIRERIRPLISVCKKHGTAMRVGSNHGSLSPRITDRFGDTPEGMAISVMEFCRICDELDFHNIVVSMKSSNTRVMVHATRLLVRKMEEEGFYYPVHLGVTEAGSGIEGRVKSAVGIGTLLAEEIGDTIRVSLTESPEKELPVASNIVEAVQSEKEKARNGKLYPAIGLPFSYQRRESFSLEAIGNKSSPVVISPDSNTGFYKGNAPDFIFSDGNKGNEVLYSFDRKNDSRTAYSLSEVHQIKDSGIYTGLNFVKIRNIKELEAVHQVLANKPFAYILLANPAGQHEMIHFLENEKAKNPVILYHFNETNDWEAFAIEVSSLLGPFFINGRADGIWLDNPTHAVKEVAALMYTILQGSRSRISKTEFIACPSCGRTEFDIEQTLQKVKEKTGHLKGLKIAVMGCIVNGPGEMADADYGYVGAARGKVTLYKGKTVKKKNIAEEKAIDELINLIKEEGDWKPVFR
ncbi:MAG: (E)-4-hydroxy-3-methylbut-2-enyl-diphosphate synthase [Bacteroidales bacterium]|nr:(E)-4-hydroxy-3-methylbut-2-enyl-diphosphate synthase [Bacteroidales bacterium]MCF8332517.1 (E)-4-hydroxy-3-methylbut-2-enyl-diphosphate synthase [Bacteroidales bacterium]